MTPLKPTTVYVPVSVDEKLPEKSTFYLCNVIPSEYNTSKEAESFFHKESNRFIIGPNERFTKVTHWLKEQQGYFLTKEELTAILGEAFDAGKDREDWDREEYSSKEYVNCKEDHIKSVII